MKLQKTIKAFLLVAAISITSINTNAQIVRDEFDHRNLNLHSDTAIIETRFLIEKKPLFVKEKKHYFWYRERKIHITQGGIPENPLDGYFRVFSPDGYLKKSGHFNKGLKNRKWKTWNKKGKLLTEKRYCKGVLQGRSRIYAKDSVEIIWYWQGNKVSNKMKPIKSE